MRLLLDTQVLIWWLLIAQARLEGLMAVSSDAHWPRYNLALHRA
jgi:PIN domain nuclease of toxin-antitoxin system